MSRVALWSSGCISQKPIFTAAWFARVLGISLFLLAISIGVGNSALAQDWKTSLAVNSDNCYNQVYVSNTLTITAWVLNPGCSSETPFSINAQVNGGANIPLSNSPDAWWNFQGWFAFTNNYTPTTTGFYTIAATDNCDDSFASIPMVVYHLNDTTIISDPAYSPWTANIADDDRDCVAFQSHTIVPSSVGVCSVTPTIGDVVTFGLNTSPCAATLPASYMIRWSGPTPVNFSAAAPNTTATIDATQEAMRELSDQRTPQEKALESLVSSNSSARLEAAMALDGQRAQLVRKLVDILNSTNSEKVKVDAAIVLGEYRAPEAIPSLVNHLEWDEVTAGVFYGMLPRERIEELSGPVTIALRKIGVPAIPALLRRIADTDDTKITWKCVRICVLIEDWDVTRFRVQGLLEKETDQKHKGRIQSALESLETLRPVK